MASTRKKSRKTPVRKKAVSRSRAMKKGRRAPSKGGHADGSFETATRRQIDAYIVELRKLYPDADCELEHNSALELLLATILSAQSTDKRVNLVTRDLFRKYRTAAEFATAKAEVFEKDIQSTGFYRQKTKSVLRTARQLVDKHDGEVPQTMEELVELPGVARKTANVVLGTWFEKPVGFVVDTHVRRLSNRLGLSRESDPVKIERDLMAKLPRDQWIFLGHAIIWHGRRVCHARKPDCDRCTLATSCPRNGVPTPQ